MARTIFLILTFLNLLALAWIFLAGDARNNAGREPERVKAQLAADRIHVVAAADAGLSDGAAEKAADAGASSAATAELCQGYSGATIEEGRQIAKILGEALPLAHVAITPVALPTQFNIVIPRLATHALAEAKLGELKKLGVNEPAQIKADDKQFSVLIATYAERPVADEALKALSAKGVRSAAIVEQRPAPENATVEVRGSVAVMKKLPDQLLSSKALNPVTCVSP